MSPLLIQLGLSAANAGGTALYNGITGDIENNVNNPAISNYLTNVSAINSQIAEQQAFDAVNNNLQDFSNVSNNDTLLNLGIQQTSTINEPNGGQNIGMYTGKQLQNLGNLDIVGTYDTAIQMYKDLFNIGNDSKADKINKEINRINQQNIDNFYNQVTANNKRQQRQAMMNYFAEGGLLNEFNTGGSHEENSLGGIPQGIASDGLPNLVEEGEVRSDFDDAKIFNNQDRNYTITEKDCEEYLLPKSVIGCNPAEAIKKLKKEYEDRVNDPVSIATMKEWDSRVFAFQEDKTAKIEENRVKKAIKNMSDDEKAAIMSSLEQPMTQQEGIDLSQPMYAEGGHLFIEGGPYDKYYPTGYGIDYSDEYLFPITTINIPEGDTSRQDYIVPEVENPYDNGFKYNPTQPNLINEYISGQNKLGIIENYKPQTTPKGTKDNNINLSSLRYAPAVGAALGALEARLQPKDYTLANQLRDIASKYNPVAAPNIGGYRKYTPYDINLGDAENLALQTAALRANRGQNRATQGALNTAVIAKSQEANAKRNLAAQQANEANRLATDTYNLNIDQFNAQRDTQYDQLNQQILNNRLRILMSAANAEDASRTAWANNISSTTENAFNQLGNVGKDNWNRNQMILSLKARGYDELAKMFGSDTAIAIMNA